MVRDGRILQICVQAFSNKESTTARIDDDDVLGTFTEYGPYAVPIAVLHKFRPTAECHIGHEVVPISMAGQTAARSRMQTTEILT